MTYKNSKLRKLSDKALLEQTDETVNKERAATLEVLQFLREVELRRLYIDLGYSSMYKMCLQRYKYSEGQAHRRLSAARLLTELPEIEDRIQSGDLNITTLSKVQSFVRAEKQVQHPLSKEEKLDLLQELENKSTRQAEIELVRKSHQPELLMQKFQVSSKAITGDIINGICNDVVSTGESYVKFEALLSLENQMLLEEFKNLFAHELSDVSSLSILKLLLKKKAIAGKEKEIGIRL